MRGLIPVILSWLKKPKVTRSCIHSKKTISVSTRYIKIITFVFKFKRIASVMKKQDVKKKVWVKPVVSSLNIRKDTFSGSIGGPESPQNNTGGSPPKKV